MSRLNPMAVNMNMNANMKAEAANKEIEEAMKRVREAQSLISAAIEPGSKWKGTREGCLCCTMPPPASSDVSSPSLQSSGLFKHLAKT